MKCLTYCLAHKKGIQNEAIIISLAYSNFDQIYHQKAFKIIFPGHHVRSMYIR